VQVVRRSVGKLLGLVLLVAGVLLALYGLFAILYGGDSGGSGNTYVTIAGHELDADLAGAIALLIAFFAVLFSTMFLRRERS
jgi:divalent metal cation (Fe/Co/Zn/Cd) transporter